ncbi:MAG: ABC transporter permease, partial [Eubacteriales bacterium]|nr:ABC transporter permease [Eubacteriales bacterium]
YSMLYDYSNESILTLNTTLGIISIGTAVLCALLSTYLSCIKDLKLVPAALMQPPAPKPGKRILLERIHFFWSRLSFLYKVSLRNVFRYKKRFFMMIIGISGCSALLLAGLGINDSIKGISNAQYSNITKYTYSVSFNSDMNKKIPFVNETLKDNFINELGDDYIENIFFLNTTTGTIAEKTKNNDKAKEEMSIIVLNNSSSTAKKESSNFNDFFNLRDYETAKKIEMPKEDEVIICKKLAHTHDLKINDKLTFKLDDSDKKITVKIKGIAENYVHNFLFISNATLNKYDIKTPINTAYININSDKIEKNKDIISKSSAKAISLPYVNTTLISNDMIKRIDKTTKNLDSVVLLIILSAAGLAFIVLYNLSNINITERTREIATVKVLGFTPYEIAIYVFRESVILTAIGSLLGLGLGRILLEFVISKIQVEMIYYTVNIHWYSYVLSVVLSFVFTIIVSIMMLWRLKRIDMVESLKSIE